MLVSTQLLFGCKESSETVPTDQLVANTFLFEEREGSVDIYFVGISLNKIAGDDLAISADEEALSSSLVKITENEYFTVEFNEEVTIMDLDGGEIVRPAFNVNSADQLPLNSFLTNYSLAKIPSTPEGGELIIEFHRGDGEVITSSVVVPPAINLISPVDGLIVVNQDEDLEAAWTGAPGDYQVVVEVESKTGKYIHQLRVPAEQGVVSLSSIEQSWVDLVCSEVESAFTGEIRLSVAAVNTHYSEETPYSSITTKVQRKPSSALVNLLQVDEEKIDQYLVLLKPVYEALSLTQIVEPMKALFDFMSALTGEELLFFRFPSLSKMNEFLEIADKTLNVPAIEDREELLIYHMRLMNLQNEFMSKLSDEERMLFTYTSQSQLDIIMLQALLKKRNEAYELLTNVISKSHSSRGRTR